MSCAVSHGVVWCQLGYLGAVFAVTVFAQLLVIVYLTGKRRGGATSA